MMFKYIELLGYTMNLNMIKPKIYQNTPKKRREERKEKKRKRKKGRNKRKQKEKRGKERKENKTKQINPPHVDKYG